MSLKIEQDHARFREIVRGRIKQNLRKYIPKGEMIGKKGKDLITIPVPTIDIPHFRFGERSQGGVGQGEGEPGDPLAQGDPQPGSGQAGERRGRSTSSRSTSRSTSWPRSSARSSSSRASSRKGKEQIVATQDQVHRHPPHRPRVAAPLQAHLQAGAAAADRDAAPTTRRSPVIVPIREDQRYRSLEARCRCRETNAVIIYMMDVSGSMGDEQKEIVRIESFWIDTWLRTQYKGLETPLHHPRRGGAARSTATPSSTRASRAAR